MPDAPRSIFRAEAVQRYLQGREETVLPRLVSPRTFVFLWILLLLHAAAGLLTWLAEVPVYASGPAVVVDGKTKGLPVGEVAVVAFLPAETHSRLRIGQRLWLRMGPAADRLSRRLLAVEPGVRSPDSARKRWALAGAAAQSLTRPVAVAMAHLQPIGGDLPVSAHVGSVYHAEIEVGSRRVISLLPVVGPLFGG